MGREQTIAELKAYILELECRTEKFRRRQGELRASRHAYATLIETLPYGIQECTVEGIITYRNRAHHRTCGYPAGELIGGST